MNNTPEIDLIIVGQGLAGSAVALQALANGYSIQVLDQPSENRSSRIAAGLFNPVTGRKMVKTWQADEIFPALFQFYRSAERLTGRRFFHPMPVYRPFVSIEEQNEWMGKSADPAYCDYIARLSVAPVFDQQVNDPFGGITLQQTGYLDTSAYLDAVGEYLLSLNLLQMASFNSNKLVIGEDFVTYENFQAKKIIFCQGVHNASNPWFKNFPAEPLKGEFLTVQSGWKKDVILNRGVYMVPGSQPDEWRVGATYNRSDHLPEVTMQAKKDLTEKLDGLIIIPYTVTGQEWGFRPTTPDRKPILGAHREHGSLIIFNGLGTKGVSLAPYFSEVLIRWVGNKGTIDKAVDVNRFN